MEKEKEAKEIEKRGWEGDGERGGNMEKEGKEKERER